MNPARTVIKKYGKNRRFYDTSASRYVNLEDISALIRNGTEVQVIDARTGEDLTAVTLAQIIAERAKDQPSGLPLELLRQLVITTDHVGQEFIMWYLKSAFDAYHKLQSTLRTGLSKVNAAALSPLQVTREFLQAATREKQPEPDELQELRQRITELESRLKKRRT